MRLECDYLMSSDTTIDQQTEAVRFFFSGDTPWKMIYSAEGWNAFMARQRLGYVFRLIDKLKIRPDGRVLDLGCGCGQYSKTLCERGFSVTACDSSEEMVIETRKNVAEANGSVLATVADAASLPFADESFHLVLCVGVLAYLREDRQAIGEMFRVLAPGGYLIVTVRNSVRFARLPKIFAKYILRSLKLIPQRKGAFTPKKVRQYEMIQRSYVPWELDAALGRFGFRKITSFSHGFSPAILVRKSPATAQRFSHYVEKLLLALHLPFRDRLGRSYITVAQKGRVKCSIEPGSDKSSEPAVRSKRLL